MRHSTHTIRGLFSLCMLALGLVALVRSEPAPRPSLGGMMAASLCQPSGERLGAHAQARTPGDLGLLTRRLRCPD